MRNCPNCGSSAQVKLLSTEGVYMDVDEVVVYKTYGCGCGERFKTSQIYVASEVDSEDIISSWRNKEE